MRPAVTSSATTIAKNMISKSYQQSINSLRKLVAGVPHSLVELPRALSAPKKEVQYTVQDEHQFKEVLKNAPIPDRVDLTAKRRISYKLDEAEMTGTCPHCWLAAGTCICSRMPVIKTKHKFFVYMHYMEFFRTSNTGKILLSCTEGSELFISGVKEHDERLRQLLEQSKDDHTSVVLFPSEDALTVPEFYEKFHKNKTSTNGNNNSNNDDDTNSTLEAKMGNLSINTTTTTTKMEFPPLNIIVLDGTWGQARNLLKNFPAMDAVSKIRLVPPEDNVSLFAPLRKQTQQDRISTLESSVMLLRELGEPAEVCDQYIHNLKVMVDQVRKNSRQPIVYGTIEFTGKRQQYK